jgi:hypothetical protein
MFAALVIPRSTMLISGGSECGTNQLRVETSAGDEPGDQHQRKQARQDGDCQDQAGQATKASRDASCANGRAGDAKESNGYRRVHGRNLGPGWGRRRMNDRGV